MSRPDTAPTAAIPRSASFLPAMPDGCEAVLGPSLSSGKASQWDVLVVVRPTRHQAAVRVAVVTACSLTVTRLAASLSRLSPDFYSKLSRSYSWSGLNDHLIWANMGTDAEEGGHHEHQSAQAREDRSNADAIRVLALIA